MVLREVKDFLEREKRLTLSQLTAHVGEDRASVGAALAYLVERGFVCREFESAQNGSVCGTACNHCPLGTVCLIGSERMNGLEVFTWTGDRRNMGGNGDD